jgi:Resolvase, N terminal domain
MSAAPAPDRLRHPDRVAIAVIREAMRSKAMVALGRLVLSKRERVIALEPYEKELLGTTLRYPYEVRPAADYFGDLPDLAVGPDMLTLAEHILDTKAGGFEPASFRDRYEEALLAHLKAKQAGHLREQKPDNLDLAFTSLDAQREACEAYIKIQAAEGWRLLAKRYDDGGISGASLQRPALQSLLTDIGDRKVDIVVVYKVDRLTRSLADFAKLIQLFEAHACRSYR